MFNPNKYQFLAKFLRAEEDLAVLEIKQGAKQAIINLPLEFLPPGIEENQEFVFKIMATETAREGEYESMRRLLEELIN